MDLPYYMIEMTLEQYNNLNPVECRIYCDIKEFCENNPYRLIWTDGEVVRTYKGKIVILK